MTIPQNGPPILRMRNAIIAVGQAAKAEDKRAGLQAAKVCWEAAKEFFADDPPSKASFRERLEGILSELKEENYDEAFQSANKVLYQIQQLCKILAGAGQLPEFIEELKQVSKQMNRFEFNVGHLCYKTYYEEGQDDDLIVFGMLRILAFAFAGNFMEGDTPAELLESYASKSNESAGLNQICRTLSLVILDKIYWARFESTARSNNLPKISPLLDWLLFTFEKKHPRPPEKVFAPYYTLLAEFIFSFGLHLVIMQPKLAADLLEEMHSYFPEKFFII